MRRRQYNGGAEPESFGRMGFRSRFPPEFDDPFGKRSYENSIYGGSFQDLEPRERFNPYNLREEPFGPDDYTRYDYPDKFSNRNQPLMHNVDTFFQMANSNNNDYNSYRRRVYDRFNDKIVQSPPPAQRQRNQSQYIPPVWPQEIERQDVIEDLQIENTQLGNNFTPFDEQPATQQTTVPNPEPEKQEKYKNVEVKCKVCNITLTSKIVYEDHIRGKKHMKKETDAKKYSCDLCCTQMFTMEEQKAHNETEQHLESLKVAEFFEKQRAEDPDLQKVKALCKKQSDMISKAEIEALKSLPNSINKYKCDLCNVVCNAPQMLALHNSSKKHIKRENEAKLNSKASAIQYSCEICQFLCYSNEEHEAHSNSDEHAKALAEKYKAGAIQAPAVPKEVIAAGIPTDEMDVIPERGADNALWYTCKLCNVKTNSLENHKMHINSKKHKTKSSQPGAQFVDRKAKYSSEALRSSYTRFVSGGGLGKKITGDPGAYCAKCEIQFKTPQELESHFLTLAHKNHNPYKKKRFFDQDQSTKKTKLNNGTAVISGNITPISTTITTNQNNAVPMPTSDYGYGSYDHLQPQQKHASSYGKSYYSSSGYQNSNEYSGSAYQAAYQSPGSYGYSTTSGGYETSSYGHYENQSAYSTESQPAASYSYSAPYYQH